MSVTSSAIIPNPWVRILDALEKKVNRHSYDTWLKPTRYSHADNGILFVRVPTAEFRTVGDKYADLIRAIDNLGLNTRRKVRYRRRRSAYPDPPQWWPSMALPATGRRQSFIPNPGPLRPGQRRSTQPALPFDAFVIGSGNQLPTPPARLSPSARPRPTTCFSSTAASAGKTHPMQAIGHEVKCAAAGAICMYPARNSPTR
jgi:chromosomal replication initiator protein